VVKPIISRRKPGSVVFSRSACRSIVSLVVIVGSMGLSCGLATKPYRDTR
jgi:hypothetical protein